MNKRLLRCLGGGLLALLFSVLGVTSLAYADEADDTVVTKALLQGLSQCYDNGVFKSSIKLSDVSGIDSILEKTAGSTKVNIPNGLVGNVSKSQITCKELLKGVNGWFSTKSTSILKDKTVIPNSLPDDAVRAKFLVDMGYQLGGGSSQRCVHFKYDYTVTTISAFNTNTGSSPMYTHHICAVVDGNNKIASPLSVVKDGDSTIVEFELTKQKSAVQLDCDTAFITGLGKGGCGEHNGAIGTDWNEFRNSIFNDLAKNKGSFNGVMAGTGQGTSVSYEYKLSVADDVVQEVDGLDYELRNDAKSIVLQKYTGSTQPIVLNNNDQAKLYVTYLLDYYEATQACGNFSESQKTSYEGQGFVRYKDGSDGNICYVKANKNTNNKVNGVTNGVLNNSETSFNDVVNFLKSYTGNVDVGVDTAETLNPELTPSDEKKSECSNGGGAQALGWIICPIISVASDGANNFYNDYVKDNLQVQPTLFANNTDTNSGMAMAWGTFRTIANSAFIVLLMVVIVSQVTGYGIDNYGIKKILPKMIVAAVLINVSFLICQICVDLSNIAGNGIQNLFDSLGNGIKESASVTIDGETIGGNAGDAVTAVTLLGGIVGLAAIWANPAIILTLLVSAVGVFISLLFLFVLLAGRKAVIVVLTVIAPIAVVLFMLPNTKKYFDKWLKLWGAMLLLYPVSGLLVGGGNYVSKLLLSIPSTGGLSGVFEAFTAMIAGVLPIFFIPSVLKSSFSALGSVGGRIASLGDRLRGGATGKIRSSEGYRAAQVRGYARKTRIRAGLDKNYKPTALGNAKAKLAKSGIGKALGYSSLQRSRISSARKVEAAMLEGDAMLGALQMEYAQSKTPQNTEEYLRQKLVEVASSKDDNAKFSVIDQMLKAGVQSSHIAQITRDVFGQKEQDKNFLEKFANRYGNSFLRKDFEQADWARKGGLVKNKDGSFESAALGRTWVVDKKGNRHLAGGEWARDNIAMDDMKDEDVAALSSDRLHDLIGTGLISQAQAQRIWASNTNMDDTNRLIMGAYGNAGMKISKGDAQNALTGVYKGTAATLTDQMRAAYTERAATDTRITDVEWKNRYGEHQQTDELYVDHRGETRRINHGDGRPHQWVQNKDGSWTDGSGNTFSNEQFNRIERRLNEQRNKNGGNKG